MFFFSRIITETKNRVSNEIERDEMIEEKTYFCFVSRNEEGSFGFINIVVLSNKEN